MKNKFLYKYIDSIIYQKIFNKSLLQYNKLNSKNFIIWTINVEN